MSDAAILSRCKAEHDLSIVRAVSHELVANNHTWSIERRDELVRLGLTPPSNWSSVQAFELYGIAEKYHQPTLKIYSNSHMAKAAAENVFNIMGIVRKDSTFGQGQNLAMLTMSPDVQAEIYAYDALERIPSENLQGAGAARTFTRGTVTMYVLLDPPGEKAKHHHLTVPFFVTEIGEKLVVFWLTPNGEYDAPQEKRNDLQLFRQHTLMRQIRDGMVIQEATNRRVDDVILKQVVKRATESFNQSCVVQFVSGKSWESDPPIKRNLIEGTTDKYDLVCRWKDQAAGRTRWESLSKQLAQEWRSFPISTKALPKSERDNEAVTVGYMRKVLVCGRNVTGLPPGDPAKGTTAWIVQQIEEGKRLDADDPGRTETYLIQLNEQDRKDPDDELTHNYAVVCVRVHPDACRQELLEGEKCLNQIKPADYRQRSNFITGTIWFLGRYHGSVDQLLEGGMTNSYASPDVYDKPSLDKLTSMVGEGQIRDRVVEFAKKLGCTPDAAGNFKNADDMAVLDNAFGGRENAGLDTLNALHYKEHKKDGGLQPEGRTDILTRLQGTELLVTVEHNAGMKADKVQLHDGREGVMLATRIRQIMARHALEYDPVFKDLREQLESDDFAPRKYDNDRKGGDEGEDPRGELGAPVRRRSDAVRAKHRFTDAAALLERRRGASAEIYAYEKAFVEEILDTTLEVLQDGPQDPDDSGEAPDDWPEDSAEYQLRELLLKKDGLAEIALNDKEAGALCRRQAYAMYQVDNRLDKCTAAVDPEVASARSARHLAVHKRITRALAEYKAPIGGKRKRAGAATPVEELEADQEAEVGGEDEAAGAAAPATANSVVNVDGDEEAEAMEVEATEVVDGVPQGASSATRVGDFSINITVAPTAGAPAGSVATTKRPRTTATYSPRVQNNDQAMQEKWARAACDTGPDRHDGGDRAFAGGD